MPKIKMLGVGELLLSTSEEFYFELEAFLDNVRREGVSEHIVRAALERAMRASLAMESVGKRLKGADHARR